MTASPVSKLSSQSAVPIVFVDSKKPFSKVKQIISLQILLHKAVMLPFYQSDFHPGDWNLCHKPAINVFINQLSHNLTILYLP